ncbi:terpene synthase family protein [Chitinophaga lutea]
MKQIISVPELYCPVPQRICPHVETAHAHTAQWLLDFNLVPDPVVYDRYLQERFAWMAARMYPYADEHRLNIITDLDTLLFLIDDELDHQEFFKGKAYWKQFAGTFIDILEHNAYPKPYGSPIMDALSELWHRITAISTPAWRKQFTQSITDMYNAAFWENDNLSEDKQIKLRQYLKVRQFLGAANVATDTIDIASPTIAIPPVCKDNPLLANIVELCRNTVCWANDLFSLDKELAHGDTHNLVLILKKEWELSLEEALREAARLHDQDVRTLFQLWDQALIYDDRTNEALSTYIDALTAIMRGNIDWSVAETARYSFHYQGAGPEPIPVARKY